MISVGLLMILVNLRFLKLKGLNLSDVDAPNADQSSNQKKVSY